MHTIQFGHSFIPNVNRAGHILIVTVIAFVGGIFSLGKTNSRRNPFHQRNNDIANNEHLTLSSCFPSIFFPLCSSSENYAYSIRSAVSFFSKTKLDSIRLTSLSLFSLPFPLLPARISYAIDGRKKKNNLIKIKFLHKKRMKNVDKMRPNTKSNQ